MTMKREAKFKCNKCHEEFTVAAYPTIDFEENPELKMAVLNKEVFKAVCPKCGEKHALSFPTIYRDTKHKMFVNLHSIKQEGEGSDDLREFGKMADYPDYKFRDVTDPDCFVETLLMNEFDRNDKVIAILKLFTASQAPFDKKEIFQVHYFGEHEGNLLIDILKTDRTIQHVQIPEKGYQNCYALCKEAFDKEEAKWQRIDAAWALKFFNEEIAPHVPQTKPEE